MYTANTMSTSIEAMGMSLPGSSTNPVNALGKMREWESASETIRICIERETTPRKLMTKGSSENDSVLPWLCVALLAESYTSLQWHALPKLI